MKIDLIIEPDRPDHIARHGVTVSEVREVVESVEHAWKVRRGVLCIVGQTRLVGTCRCSSAQEAAPCTD